MPLALLFADLGLLADLASEVVQLGPADSADAQHLNLTDFGRMQRKSPLHPNAEGVLSHSEGLAGAGALPLDNYSLKNLDAAAGALNNLKMHLNGITGLELGYPLLKLLGFQPRYGGIHDFSSLACDSPRPRTGLMLINYIRSAIRIKKLPSWKF